MRSGELELAFDCTRSEDELIGRGTSLYCTHCRHTVTVLSAMTACDAEAFVRNARRGKERVCVAYDVDCRGRPIFVPERLHRQLAGAAALVAGAALVATSLATSLRHETRIPPPPASLWADPEPSPPQYEMQTPDPNAAFDSWDFVGRSELDEALLSGAEDVDLATWQRLQDRRQERKRTRRMGKLATSSVRVIPNE